MVKYISPVNILFVSKTSSRHLQDMSSRRLQDMSSRRLQDMSSRRLQRNNFLSSKMSLRRFMRSLQDVFKTSSQDVFKMSWKTKNWYAEDVLKTSSRHVLKTSLRRLEDQQMFAGLVQFNKRQIYPWKSVTLEACNFTEATLLQGCFSRFLNCSNCIKLRKGSFKNILYSIKSFKNIWQKIIAFIFLPQAIFLPTFKAASFL